MATTVKNILLALIGLIAVVAIAVLIWCVVSLSDRVEELETYNAELVDWLGDVQEWSVNVSKAIWGPGGDPCCSPPKPPPELE